MSVLRRWSLPPLPSGYAAAVLSPQRGTVPNCPLRRGYVRSASTLPLAPSRRREGEYGVRPLLLAGLRLARWRERRERSERRGWVLLSEGSAPLPQRRGALVLPRALAGEARAKRAERVCPRCDRLPPYPSGYAAAVLSPRRGTVPNCPHLRRGRTWRGLGIRLAVSGFGRRAWVFTGCPRWWGTGFRHDRATGYGSGSGRRAVR